MLDLIEKLQACDLFAGMSADDVRQIVDAAGVVEAASGRSICREGEAGDSMFIIVAGRVRVSIQRGDREEILNYLGEGDQFGELAMLIGGNRSATITAVMDTRLLELTKSEFQQLLNTIPGFAANLCRTLGRWLQSEIAGSRPHNEAITLAMVRPREGVAARDLAEQIARTFTRGGRRVQVLTDRPEQWPMSVSYDVRWLSTKTNTASTLMTLQAAVAVAANCHGRVLIDVSGEMLNPALLMQCELVWWLVEAEEVVRRRARLAGLERLVAAEPELAGRVQIVWLHKIRERLPAAGHHSIETTHADERIGWSPRDDESTWFRPPDLARLAHRLEGTTRGIALGGGGAKGLAHLGVLKVLDEEGIHFDQIAGTSAGAMVGLAYAAGIAVDEILELFSTELTPPRWMRALPRANRWFMIAMYRLGLAERKLRKYLFDYSFDQLFMPAHTVTVDLVGGCQRVRDAGDVVDAILESINLPIVGAPILRDGAALVDGGVLVNVPASVLRRRNCDFVLAVDVSAKLKERFADSTPDTPTRQMRRPGMLETITRVMEVHQRGLAALHASESDFLITPDTSSFPFDDFSLGPGLMSAGELAARDALPRLAVLLTGSAAPIELPRRRAA